MRSIFRKVVSYPIAICLIFLFNWASWEGFCLILPWWPWWLFFFKIFCYFDVLYFLFSLYRKGDWLEKWMHRTSVFEYKFNRRLVYYPHDLAIDIFFFMIHRKYEWRALAVLIVFCLLMPFFCILFLLMILLLEIWAVIDLAFLVECNIWSDVPKSVSFRSFYVKKPRIISLCVIIPHNLVYARFYMFFFSINNWYLSTWISFLWKFFMRDIFRISSLPLAFFIGCWKIVKQTIYNVRWRKTPVKEWINSFFLAFCFYTRKLLLTKQTMLGARFRSSSITMIDYKLYLNWRE